MAKCPGGCCAVFWLPREVPEGVADREFILDMRIELTPEQASERWAKFVGSAQPVAMKRSATEVTAPGVERPAYTCRHWDEQTRLCTVYDQRPMICRDYPYGQPCSHGCDYQVDDETVVRYAGSDA